MNEIVLTGLDKEDRYYSNTEPSFITLLVKLVVIMVAR